MGQLIFLVLVAVVAYVAYRAYTGKVSFTDEADDIYDDAAKDENLLATDVTDAKDEADAIL